MDAVDEPGATRPMNDGSPDRHAWIRAALEQYEAPLVTFARRITGDLETARDVVQDAFLKLVDADRAAVEPKLAEWLFTVCRNRALDERRKVSRRNETVSDRAEAGVLNRASGEPGPAEAFETKDSASVVLAALGRLPDSQQEAIRLKFQQGLSYKEIARVTEQSVGNVGWLIHTGLKTLRERLAGAPAAEGSTS